MKKPMLAVLTIAAAFAADSKRTESPVLGYVYDGGELRAILGVPGSSTWSDPIALPDSVSSLSLAPGHRWALATRDTGIAVLQFDTMAMKALAAGSMDSAVFSPSGAAAAVRQGDLVRVYTGLPDSASAKAEANVAGFDSLAVSDDGFLIGSQDGVLVSIDASGAQALYRPSAAGPYGFFPGTRAIAVFDGGKLVEVSGGDVRVICDGLDKADLISAGDVITLASRDAAKVWQVSRQSGAVAASDVPSVDRLEATRIAGMLLLSSDAGSPAWMLMSDGIRFVPARSGEQQ